MAQEITIGSKIKIEISSEVKIFEIVGSAEVDAKNGKISYLSPIGEAVLGKMAGQEFNIDLPTGKKIQGKIIKIF